MRKNLYDKSRSNQADKCRLLTVTQDVNKIRLRCQLQCAQSQTLLCERNNLMQSVTVLTLLCEPSTRQSLDMWLERQVFIGLIVPEG